MKILMIIAPKDFRDEEYFTPKKRFEAEGYEVVTSSLIKGECLGKLGGSAHSDLLLKEVEVDNFAAVVFIGGSGATIYQKDSDAERIIKETLEKGKVLAAICIAPLTLACAGVLKDRKATVWNKDGEEEKIFRELGVNFSNEDVVVDNDIITANGPKAAEKFAEAIIKKLV